MGLRTVVLAAFATAKVVSETAWNFSCDTQSKKLEYCDCIMNCEIYPTDWDVMCGDNGITVQGQIEINDITKVDACTTKKCSVYCLNWLGCYKSEMIENCKLWQQDTEKERVIPLTMDDGT